MRNDALEEVESNIDIWIPEIDASSPNTRYDNTSDNVIYTINSISDADKFCKMYTHNRNYTGLKLGHHVIINDGQFSSDWRIVGFDLEHNRQASDGTTYDNGYGIYMISSYHTIGYTYGRTNSSIEDKLLTPYIDSYIHNNILNGSIANNLKTVLGDHLINRRVLLSSIVSPDNIAGTTAYTWTTAYSALANEYNILGHNSTSTIYDTGESNYKLPIFNYTNAEDVLYKSWLRSCRWNEYMDRLEAEYTLRTDYISWDYAGVLGYYHSGMILIR